MRKVLNTIWDTSRKRPKPEPKNCFTLPLESTKQSFGPRENWPWEHRLRKPRTAKHEPESLEQQNTSGSRRSEKSQTPSRTQAENGQNPSSFKKAFRESWPTTPLLGLEQQISSRSPRCEKSQTPSGHEPKTAKTRAKKLLSRYLWNPQNNIFSASRNLALEHRFRKPRTAKHKPESLEQQNTLQNCRKISHLDTSRKRPKPESLSNIWPSNTASESLEQQNTSGSRRCEKSQTPSGHEPKTAKTRAKKLFHVTFGIHKKTIFWASRNLALEHRPRKPEHTLPKASNSKTQTRKPRRAKHKR